MITLHSVQLTNFRNFENEHITFPDVPTIAIGGANGSGKTTVLHAVMWALYGVTPDGVNVKQLKRFDADKKDDTSVTVTFQHHGQEVAVTRQLVGANARTTANVTVDGEAITLVKSRDTTSWVERRLGIDAAGFLTSVAVRQKELDALVTLPPRDRRARIEQLAGIDTLEQSVKDARTAYNNMKRAADSHEDLTDNITATEETITNAETAITTLTDEVANAETAAEDAEAAFIRIKHEQEAIAETIDQYNTISKNITDEDNKRSSLTGERTTYQQQEKKLLTITVTDDEVAAAYQAMQTAQEKVNSISAARTAATQARTTANRSAHAASEAQKALTAATSARTEAETRATEANNTLTAARTAAAQHTNPDELAAAAEQASQRAGAARGEQERLSTAISALTHTPETASCPTCQQNVANHEELIAQLTTDMNAAAGRAKDATTEANQLRSSEKEARQALTDVTTAENNLNAATASLTTAQDGEKTAQKNFTTLNNQAHTDDDDAAAAEQTAATSEAELTTRQNDLTNAQERHTTLRTQQQQRQELPALQKNIADLTTKIDAITTTITTLTQDLNALSVPTEEEKKKLREEWQHAADVSKEAKVTVTELTGKKTAAEKDKATAVTQLDDLKQRQANRAKLYTAAELSAHTVTSLDQFRKDRVAQLAPELADVASEIVNTITSGHFHTVTLDENFTATVTTATGQEIPLPLCSGGEQSVVALALRIAIGEILTSTITTGTGKNLLFLDEVLTAQDTERRQAMIQAIRLLQNRQTIMVNHIAEGLADVTYRVTGNPAHITLDTSADSTLILDNIDTDTDTAAAS